MAIRRTRRRRRGLVKQSWCPHRTCLHSTPRMFAPRIRDVANIRRLRLCFSAVFSCKVPSEPLPSVGLWYSNILDVLTARLHGVSIGISALAHGPSRVHSASCASFSPIAAVGPVGVGGSVHPTPAKPLGHRRIVAAAAALGALVERGTGASGLRRAPAVDPWRVSCESAPSGLVSASADPCTPTVFRVSDSEVSSSFSDATTLAPGSLRRSPAALQI